MCLFGVMCTGCAWFRSTPEWDVTIAERPYVALLPFGIDTDITKLSAVKSVDGTLSDEEESRQVAAVLQEILADARWLFLSRLATSQKFRFVPLEQTDALATELQLKPGALPTQEQLVEFRRRLGADVVVAGNILDYGRVRWQWFVAGAFAELSAETLVIGLATAWNPIGLLANTGVAVLINSAIFFGGGYLFGIAFRPVVVDARAFETIQGYPVWQSMEGAFYAWSALKQLPESQRDKKESQLRINLGRAIEGLADSLKAEKFTVLQLETTPGEAQP
jgi:nucleotide-binding universal stress UspA family protein